jgi:glycosyltransferase involved in cell wall biosynthesis
MKLLYLHDSPISAEKANVVQALHMCYAFARAGSDVILAVPDGGFSASVIEDQIYRKMNSEVPFSVLTYPKITIGGRLSLVGGILGIKKVLEPGRFDVCFLRNPLFVHTALGKNVRTIFESHNSLLHKKNKIFDTYLKKKLILNTKNKLFLKFIAISNALAEVWRSRGVPEKKILALHDAVDADSFEKIPDQSMIRKELNLPSEKKLVLYAGSLYPDRGIESILNLALSFPEALFVVLGGPDERRTYYLKRSEDLNIQNIAFLGYIPHHEVKRYLFAADVLLMIWTKHVKTINFCSPLKMFEYMASGRIIVGHAFPTIKEVLTDGETALLADPDSFEELRHRLAKALEQTYPNPMAQEARRLALSRHTWQSRVETILKNIEA